MDSPIDLAMELMRLQGEIFTLAFKRLGWRTLWFAGIMVFLFFGFMTFHVLLWSLVLFVLPDHFIIASLSVLGFDFFCMLFCCYLATRTRKPTPLQKEITVEREEKIEQIRQMMQVSTLMSFLNSPVGKTALIWGTDWLVGLVFGRRDKQSRRSKRRDSERNRKRGFRFF